MGLDAKRTGLLGSMLHKVKNEQERNKALSNKVKSEVNKANKK